MFRFAAVVTVAAALWIGPAAVAEASACDVHGVVRDPDGAPVAGIEVALQQGAALRRTATDSEGRYRFVAAPAGPLQVTVVLADAAHNPPRFRLFHERRGITVASDAFNSDSGCERNFDFGAIDERYPDGAFRRQWWPDAITLFQGFSEALSLSPMLGVDLGRVPLEINAFYAASSPDASFWVGTPSYAPDSDRKPFIGLGVHASTRADGGWPGNREDHEIAHHMLAQTLGGVHPHARADTSHGGYWANPTSADAWGEGFASFYAVMVAKHVRKAVRPSWLPVDGGVIDLERNYQPWDLGGLEEVAVAGLLVDLEDGPDDYDLTDNPSELSVADASVLVHGDTTLMRGAVRAATGSPAGTVVELALLDGSDSVVATTRAVVDGDPESDTGHFVAVVPADLAIESARIRKTAVGDDDPVDLSLLEIWQTIASFKSSKPESNGRLFDVADLYAAMKAKFGGRDADSDGVDDIDQLFVAHGLFADRNGDRTRDASEPLGQTGHPASEVAQDGRKTERPALEPRFRLALPAQLRAAIALPNAESSLVVIASADGNPPVVYHPQADRDGRVTLIPPPSKGGTLTVLAVGGERELSVVTTMTAEAMLASIEAHSESFLEYTATFDGAAVAAEAKSRGDLRYAWGLFVGGAVTLLFGVVLVGVGFARRP